jgi:hypothetical protein
MSPTPYDRPGLGESDPQRSDSGAVVVDWLGRLRQLLDERPRDLPARAAHDLLALTAALRRVRPGLLPAAGPEPVAERAQARLERATADELNLAAELIRPGAWLAAAQALQGQEAEPGERAEETARLLRELDEADLAAWSLRHLGHYSEAREQGLETCAAWLEEQAAVFRPAAAYVRAVGRGLRPDLAALDLDLAWTADKFVLLLDDQEKAEQERWLDQDVPPLPAELLAAARARLRRRNAARGAWLPPPLAPPLAAAATPTAAPRLHLLRWRSPDGRQRASLVLPGSFDASPADPVVRLNLFDGDEPARDRSGQPLSLAGVPAVVDAEGGAAFRVADLRAAQEAGRAPILHVGPAADAWEGVGEE